VGDDEGGAPAGSEGAIPIAEIAVEPEEIAASASASASLILQELAGGRIGDDESAPGIDLFGQSGRLSLRRALHDALDREVSEVTVDRDDAVKVACSRDVSLHRLDERRMDLVSDDDGTRVGK
jgi:hypothetical protein